SVGPASGMRSLVVKSKSDDWKRKVAIVLVTDIGTLLRGDGTVGGGAGSAARKWGRSGRREACADGGGGFSGDRPPGRGGSSRRRRSARPRRNPRRGCETRGGAARGTCPRGPRRAGSSSSRPGRSKRRAHGFFDS